MRWYEQRDLDWIIFERADDEVEPLTAAFATWFSYYSVATDTD